MLLYAGYAGSKLYNLMTPDSDIDVRGVFIEPTDIFFSLDTFDYYEDIPSDTVMFSLRKFAGMALKNNPNTLDLLFAPRSMWITTTPEWEQIYAIRHSIISKKVLSAYKGFILQEYDKWLVNKTPRQHLVEQYGYDGKMVSHVMRLIYQMRDVNLLGDYSPVLCDWERSFVYGMKTHQIDRPFIEEMVNNWLTILPNWKGEILRDEPDYDLVNQTVIDIHKRVLVSE